MYTSKYIVFDLWPHLSRVQKTCVSRLVGQCVRRRFCNWWWQVGRCNLCNGLRHGPRIATGDWCAGYGGAPERGRQREEGEEWSGGGETGKGEGNLVGYSSSSTSSSPSSSRKHIARMNRQRTRQTDGRRQRERLGRTKRETEAIFGCFANGGTLEAIIWSGLLRILSVYAGNYSPD